MRYSQPSGSKLVHCDECDAYYLMGTHSHDVEPDVNDVIAQEERATADWVASTPDYSWEI